MRMHIQSAHDTCACLIDTIKQRLTLQADDAVCVLVNNLGALVRATFNGLLWLWNHFALHPGLTCWDFLLTTPHSETMPSEILRRRAEYVNTPGG